MQAVNASRNSECSPVPENFPVGREFLADVITSVQPMLYRLAFRMLRNTQDAQDALQDALLLAFRNLSQFKGQAQISTWLAAIVMNSARMYIRRRHSRAMQSFPQIEGQGMLEAEDFFVDKRPGPEEIYGRAELHRKLHRAAEALSPKIRVAFQMVVLQNLSIREAAQTLGVSTATIKARVFHGRKQVLRILKASAFRRINKHPVAHYRVSGSLDEHSEVSRVPL